jgi:putative transposase
MDNEYKHTQTTVSLINYHLVFCPRYRRKIFNIDGVEQRFKELTSAECKAHNIDILAMECHIDHVHMFVSVYPQQSIPDVVKQIICLVYGLARILQAQLVMSVLKPSNGI